MSQNMVVSWRRSAPTSARAGLGRTTGAGSAVSDGQQRRHRAAQALAIAKRQTELNEIGIGQIGEDVEIEALLREKIGVLAKTGAFEPALETAIRRRARLRLRHCASIRPALRRRGPSTTDFGGQNLTSDWTRFLLF